MSKPKIVILSGAGMSAESGIKTFRDGDGLWRKYRFEEVASPIAWANDPQTVLDFYNERRKQLFELSPNAGHMALARLERYFDVEIITQNVDDLHERAGSKKVLHLHGELKKARSTLDHNLVYELDQWELKLGDVCEKGSQLRPHIVWFGEAVPAMAEAVEIAKSADVFLIIGTSLLVYPAASLVDYVSVHSAISLIDPKPSLPGSYPQVNIIRSTAAEGVPIWVDEMIRKHS